MVVYCNAIPAWKNRAKAEGMKCKCGATVSAGYIT